MQAFGDRPHGLFPVRIVDLDSPQAEHGPGVDAAFLVDLESLFDHSAQLGPGILAPAAQAPVDQLLCRLQSLVEREQLPVVAAQLVLAVKRKELHVAFDAAKFDAVPLAGKLYKGVHIRKEACLDGPHFRLQRLDLLHLFIDQRVTLNVDRADIGARHEAPLCVLHVAFGNLVFVKHCFSP